MNKANASRHRAVGNVVDEVGRRERQQAQHIAELENQVTRLQDVVKETWAIDAFTDIVGGYSQQYLHDHRDEKVFDHLQRWMSEHGLQPGDLDRPKGNDDGLV